ncbi:hypothetical protein EMIT0162MI3_30651 [Pseudomonas chlororaphis]
MYQALRMTVLLCRTLSESEALRFIL